MEPYIVDNNIVKWSGFYKTEEEAQKSLDERVKHISKKKNIVSAKKELQERKPNNELLHKLNDLSRHVTNNMLLYKFVVVTAPREQSPNK